ncbi:MAG TPA: BrnT family toxin [Candidatus Binatia bacterium]|nr:BrnT family toxin [Candidatus Binatia bacterium]
MIPSTNHCAILPLALEDNRLYTVSVRFEWDPAKAAANLRTHRVSFSEAVSVLEDEFALTREDPDALEEQRFVTLGLSNLGNLLSWSTRTASRISSE